MPGPSTMATAIQHHQKKSLQYKISTNCTTRAPVTWYQVLMHSYALPRVNDNPYTALNSCGYIAVLST